VVLEAPPPPLYPELEATKMIATTRAINASGARIRIGLRDRGLIARLMLSAG
jgi:hypothetical protein